MLFAVSRYVKGLHITMLPIEISELGKGWKFIHQNTILIAIFVFKHKGICSIQAIVVFGVLVII